MGGGQAVAPTSVRGSILPLPDMWAPARFRRRRKRFASPPKFRERCGASHPLGELGELRSISPEPSRQRGAPYLQHLPTAAPRYEVHRRKPSISTKHPERSGDEQLFVALSIDQFCIGFLATVFT